MKSDRPRSWEWRNQGLSIDPEGFNVLMSYRGTLSGTLVHKPINQPVLRDADNRIVYGVTGPEDSIVWTVEVPESGEYQTAVHYTGKMYLGTAAQLLGSNDQLAKYGFAGQTFSPECRVKVAANNTALQGDLGRLTDFNEPNRIAGTRQWLDGRLPLTKGRNTIVLSFPEVSEHQVRAAKKEIELGTLFKSTASLGIKSLELVKPEVWSGMCERARDSRSDTTWMVDGRYGLFIHWSLLTYPLHGDKQALDNFEWGVNVFDAEAFAGAIQSTGASWVTFTTCHGAHYFPAPIQALDDQIPGRTSRRDLIGDIADALNKRGIKLLLYYNLCGGDEPFAKSVGMEYAEDPEKWFSFLVRFTTEVSERYGNHIGGWGYIDSTVTAYEYGMQWEPFASAMKAANPNAVVGISNHWWGQFTPFNELQTADSGSYLIDPIQSEAYQAGGRYSGLQPHFSFTLDGSWIPREPYRGKIATRSSDLGGPLHTEQAYVDYFTRMKKESVPVTINMLITQDVTSGQQFFNPKSLDMMRRLRTSIK